MRHAGCPSFSGLPARRSTLLTTGGRRSTPFDDAEFAVGNAVERAYARSDLLAKRRELMRQWGDFVTGADATPSERS